MIAFKSGSKKFELGLVRFTKNASNEQTPLLIDDFQGSFISIHAEVIRAYQTTSLYK